MNQGKVEKEQAIDEQLLEIGIKPSDLDYVLFSHLDCDHANGVGLVKDAKHILVSKDELIGSRKKTRKNQIRFQTKWWKEMILPGVCADKDAQRKSLEWIRAQSMNDNCIESLANHDADVIPQNICL